MGETGFAPQRCTVALVGQHNCHPVIKTYAASVGADQFFVPKIPMRQITGPLYSLWLAATMPHYDAYFTDSIMSNLVPIFKRLMGDKNIIIYRGGDGIFGEKNDSYLHTRNQLRKKILLYIIAEVDGVITESKMSAADAKQWVKCPVVLGVSYVDEIGRLSKTKRDFSARRFLFIGDYRPPYDHKGAEILVDAFNLVADDGIELYVVGKNTSQLATRVKNPNIHLEGRADSLFPYFAKCQFYVHPAKYETGPITLLEAMIAGLVPLVSKNCGHSGFAAAIDRRLLFEEISPESVAKRVLWASSLGSKTLRAYSEKAGLIRKIGFSKKDRSAEFRKNFYSLLMHARKRLYR